MRFANGYRRKTVLAKIEGLKEMFKPNSEFKKRYDRLFRQNPLGANMFLLIAELASKKGHVKITEGEIAILFNARFDDPKAYQLKGEG